MKIHPTAVIHPEAEIASDVVIGPYVCIEGPVVIGPGCVLQAHAILSGKVTLGRGNEVGYGAVIGGFPQDLSFKPEIQSEVVIGDENRIREYCTIHRGSKEGGVTRIGDGNFLMAGAHLGHDCVLGNRNILANNVLLGGHVQVEDRAFLGGGSVFHQFIRIGTLAIVQGASAFSKDIPPFCLAAERNMVFGLNVIGLRRAGLDAAQRAELKEAFQLLYQSGRNTTQALEVARNRTWGPEATAFFDFVAAAKKKGICPFADPTRGSGNGDSDS